jgi:hypothetical protein
MNTIIKLLIIASFVAAIGLLMHKVNAYGQQATIFEDQYVLCNFEGKCFTFDQDDYLSKPQIEEFNLFFNNDMDTYSMEDLTQ